MLSLILLQGIKTDQFIPETEFVFVVHATTDRAGEANSHNKHLSVKLAGWSKSKHTFDVKITEVFLEVRVRRSGCMYIRDSYNASERESDIFCMHFELLVVKLIFIA